MIDSTSGKTQSIVKADDQFGRDGRWEKDAKKALRKLRSRAVGHARMSVFRPPDDSREISVNRMGIASDAEIAEIGMRNAASDRGKKLWGWYILSAHAIKDAGCSVKLSPTHDNPFHADIIIPVPHDSENPRDELSRYARRLANRAEFRPWGNWTDPTE